MHSKYLREYINQPYKGKDKIFIAIIGTSSLVTIISGILLTIIYHNLVYLLLLILGVILLTYGMIKYE
jgi:uncharacterized membrane protein YccC